MSLYHPEGSGLVIVHAEPPYLKPDAEWGSRISQTIKGGIGSALKEGNPVYFLKSMKFTSDSDGRLVVVRDDNDLPTYLADYKGRIHVVPYRPSKGVNYQSLELKTGLVQEGVTQTNVGGFIEELCLDTVARILSSSSVSIEGIAEDLMRQTGLTREKLEEILNISIKVHRPGGLTFSERVVGR